MACKYTGSDMRTVGSIIGSSLLIVTCPVSSMEVYRWVDGTGVVHFSDAKPIDEPSLITIELVDSDAPNYDPGEDPYSVLNQARRIHANWVELVGSHRRQRRSTEPAASKHAPDTIQAQRHVSTYLLVPPSVAPAQAQDAAARQRRALEQLDLLGSRSPSINSGAHRERVIRSRDLPGIMWQDRANR